MSKKCKVAIYLRLSKEDEDIRDESNSILNQRAMLKEYVRKNFKHYELKEFVDDGFSGTNFLRPGVTEMLNQVRDGEIHCVVVKDFSRFSRDYIELGSYLNQIFPFLGVRFLSLNDNYDSIMHTGNTTDLDTSFKGLMYDLYSKDLSVKVKSSLRARKEQGQYVSANTPFGYMKDPKDRHMIVVAEDEAEVVRRIFTLTLEGKTSVEIAKLFNQEKIPTPIEFRIKKGQTSRTPTGKSFHWDFPVICSILKNQVYVGDMVYGKYDKDEVGGKKHLKPRSEWEIYRDHHAGIISREDFEKVQSRGNRSGGGIKNRQYVHPLQGKVFCGGCKKAMRLRKGGLNPYFSCRYRYSYPEVQNCVGNVNLMFLEQVILCRIEEEVSRRENVRKIKLAEENKMREKINALVKEKEILNRRKEVLQRKRLEEYERAFFDKKCHFQTDDTAIRQIEAKITEIACETDRLRKELSDKKTDHFLNLGGRVELTREWVESSIKKIIVYNENDIEIEWKSETEY